MMFTPLAFGLCAYLVTHGSQEMVSVGFATRDGARCVGHLTIGDGAPSLMFAGHAIVVDMIEGGAMVTVDDQRAVLVRKGARA